AFTNCETWLVNQVDTFSMAVLITNISEEAGEPINGRQKKHNLADSLNYSSSKLAVLKKQFVAESAEINHNVAESTGSQVGLYRLPKPILLLDSAGTRPVRAKNSESEV